MNTAINQPAMPGCPPAQCYVANVRNCRQVGSEQWQFYTHSLVLTGNETVAEIIAWAQKIELGANVELVKAT